MKIVVAGVTVVPAEDDGVATVARGTCLTPAQLAASGGKPLLAHHTSLRCARRSHANLPLSLQVARGRDELPTPEHE